MALSKYASSLTIESWRGSGELMGRTAHRHQFKYTPRKGYIYVRSRAISSRMNDNFDLFEADEIRKAWRTFIGKPVFVNHRNENHKRARGVIIDAALHEDVNPDGTPDVWVELLHEIDAVRFPKLAKAILKGEVDRTSMGTNVEWSQCTACGNKAATPAEYCQHIPRLKGMKIRRVNAATGAREEVIIAERCVGLSFFENSLLVEEPADPTAFFTGVEDHSGLQVDAILLHDKGKWTEEDERKHPRGNPDNAGEFRKKDGSESDTSAKEDKKPDGPQEGSAADAPASSTKWQSPNTTGTGTKADPISTDNVEDAARALIQGHHVELRQPRQVSTLVDRLAEEIAQAKETGSKLSINLCNVTAKGTNIFCTESKGIPRIKMPQLKSKVATPGSRATQEITPNEFGEYDLQPAFLQSLREDGVRTSDTEVLASHLKATQSELNTEKIAGMMDKILAGNTIGDEPIFVSNDDYIVDGHHRWAATIAADYDDGVVSELTLPIHVIDMDIITLLSKANHFAEDWGLPAQGVTARKYRPFSELRRSAARQVPVTKIQVGDEINLGYGGQPVTITEVKPIAQYDVDGNPGMRLWWTAGPPAGAGFRDTDTLSVVKPGRRGLTDQQMADRWSPPSTGRTSGGCPICDKQVSWPPPAGGTFRPHNFGRTSTSPCPASGMTVEEAYAYMDKQRQLDRQRTYTKVAFGEQVAPPEVDTLRDEECPVCGSDESYNGEKCLVCGYLTPPDMFQDPDLTKAQEINLRQDDVADDLGADEPLTCNTCGATFGDGDTPDAPVDDDAVGDDVVPGEDDDEEVNPDDPDEGVVGTDGMDLDAGDPAKKFPEGTHTDDDPKAKAKEDDDDDDSDEDKKKKAPFKPKSGKIDPFERLEEGDDVAADTTVGLTAGDSCPKCGEGTLEPSTADPVGDPSVPDQGSIEDARVGARRRTHMGPTLAAVAAQQRTLAAQNQAILAIARFAGLEAHPDIVALQRVADAENPAQPEPEPASESAVLVPSIPQGTTEVTTPGSSPVTDVAPDATTSLTDPGGVLTDVGPDATADVQAPVTGTQEGADNTVETEVVSEKGDNTSTMFPLEGGPFANKASSLRQIASMRLARLRIQAGISQSEDDLTLAAAIARSDVSDRAVEDEIATLAKVVQVQAQRAPSAAPARTAGVRSMPSLSAMPPVVAAEGRPSEDAFLFAD